jgi:hypothetical protein
MSLVPGFKLRSAGWRAAFLFVVWISVLSFAGHWAFHKPLSRFGALVTGTPESLTGHAHDPGKGDDAHPVQNSALLHASGTSPNDVSDAEHGPIGDGPSPLLVAAPVTSVFTHVPIRTFGVAAPNEAPFTGFDSRSSGLPLS